MNIHPTKGRMAIVSDLLAILTFIVLALVFKAQSSQFNTAFFMEEVHKIHLTNEDVKTQYNSITNIQTEVNTYIKHDSVFDKYLDEICENTVGNTMLKLLVSNAKAKPIKRSLRLCDDFDPECDGSFYDPLDFLVSVKLNYYNENGIGIPGRGYYGVDKEGSLHKKGKTVIGSLFHEFTHVLHDLEGNYEQYKDKSLLA